MISLERQEEYELRQVLFSEINKDIDNNFQGVYEKISHDFGKEILNCNPKFHTRYLG